MAVVTVAEAMVMMSGSHVARCRMRTNGRASRYNAMSTRHSSNRG